MSTHRYLNMFRIEMPELGCIHRIVCRISIRPACHSTDLCYRVHVMHFCMIISLYTPITNRLHGLQGYQHGTSRYYMVNSILQTSSGFKVHRVTHGYYTFTNAIVSPCSSAPLQRRQVPCPLPAYSHLYSAYSEGHPVRDSAQRTH
jgi:hypothetical protein